MFMKFSYFLLFLTIIIFMTYFSYFTTICISIDFYNFSNHSLSKLDFSFLFSYESLWFLMMLFIVSVLVSFFSEVYLENYSFKKYFLIMFLFFLSMIILSLSNSGLVFILSWDVLGVSSVFLIMFYPNEISFYNSISTMAFNRMGDIFLLLYLVMIIKSGYLFCYMNFENFSFYLLLFCIFTKSAQFPFSTWLPLAMSAPTPISSMVHSSTLVTAGIFLLVKMFEFYDYMGTLCFFMVMSLITFIMGGLMALMEKDFKKLVAFSTMSQISMMIFFLSSMSLYFCMVHMMFHAIFKSLLFVCSGLGFSYFFMDQNKLSFSNKSLLLPLSFIMFLCSFSMSGLSYSMSFFSKDIFMEWSFSGIGSVDLYLVIIIGSFTTLSYCKIIVDFSVNINSFKNTYYIKMFNTIIIYYSFLILLICFLNFNTPIMYFSSFSFWDLVTLNMFFMFTLMKDLNIKMMTLYFLNFNMFFFNFLVNNIMLFMKFINPILYKDDFFFKVKNFISFSKLLDIKMMMKVF